MKKILISSILLGLLVGCTPTSSSNIYMVQDKNDVYGLVDVDGEEVTKFIYDKMTDNAGNGYLVKKDKEVGYVSAKGDEVIALGTYTAIEVVGAVLVATDEKGKVTIYSTDGDELYSQGKDTEITIDGLPIIKEKDSYKVLLANGAEYTSEDAITYANYVNTYSLVGFKKQFVLRNNYGSESNDITVEEKGNYQLLDYDQDKGFLLYDQEAEKILSLDPKGEVNFTKEKSIDSLHFDKNKNIIIEQGDKVSSISADGKEIVSLTSYYQDTKNYIVKNTEYVYGPHTFYQDGEKIEVEDVQLDPLAAFTSHDIFPVYVRDTGYQYYGFNGKQAFETTYRKASVFDNYSRAIVSEDLETYNLIDLENNKVSEDYVHIESIGRGYYIGYTTTSKYEIINVNGEKVIDSYFTGTSKVVKYNSDVYGIFNKSGKTYVYDMKEYTVIFEYEGDLVFHKAGYFIGEEKTYFTMKGETFYTR